jgi:AcrR family transcriptional regulator
MAGVRERARIETMAEIRRLARQQLAEVGAAGLSVRAIARDMGMVSSAVYRYVPSRDDLLTMLIIESYEALGSVVETADASVARRDDLFGRWMAIAHGTRDWAVAHPADFGLIYGTPVPGYAAPPDTIPAALRFTTVLTNLLIDAEALGVRPVEGTPAVPLRRAVRDDLVGLAERAGMDVDPRLAARGLMAWSQLMGAITIELGGHLHNVIDDPVGYFDHAMAVTGALLGVPGQRERRRSRG